jgi:chaperonin GroES
VTTRLRPVHDKIIVRRLRTEEKVGSLYIPEKGREKPTRGEVLAVGPGRFGPYEYTPPHMQAGLKITYERSPVCCKPGDVIVFGKYSGTEQDDVLIISDSDVLAVEEQAS